MLASSTKEIKLTRKKRKRETILADEQKLEYKLPKHCDNITLSNFDTIIDNDEADIKYLKNFIPGKEATKLFNCFKDTSPFVQRFVKMYGKDIKVPRLRACFGNDGISDILTSTEDKKVESWTPELIAIRDCISRITNQSYNVGLMNFYRDGKDSIGMHTDKGTDCIQGTIIASISLGGERDFHMRHIKNKKLMNIKLHSGSLLLMGGNTQKNYKHGIPKRAKADPRISVTFRMSPNGAAPISS
jgi:alkylated DNA repair dioxygenase AlkB